MLRQPGKKPRTAKTTGKDVVSRAMAGRDTGNSHNATEIKLRESEDKFRTIFMDSPYGLTLSTASEGRLLDVNPSFSTMLGFSRDELIGRTTTEVGLWDNKADRHKLLSALKKYGHARGEVILRNKSGGTINCILSTRRTFMLDNTECLITVADDIGERKKTEQALKESEQKFRNFFQNVMEACYMVSPGGKILDANNQALKLTGYGRGKLIGSPLEMLYAPESVPKFRQLFRQWLRNGAVSNEEMTILTRSGQKRQVLVNVGAVRDDDGRILYSTSVHTDITDRVQTERELKRSELALRQLAVNLELSREDEKKIIAREIHDQLGQLMTALKMDIAWIGSKLAPEQKILKRKTQSMLELANEAVQSVKRISAELRPRILDELGLAAAAEWQMDSFAKRSGIRCRVSISPADPAIEKDIAIVMFRVLQEMLTNVARHSNATNVHLSLKVDNGVLTMQVRDNGLGISPVQVSNPFSSGLTGMRERMAAIGGDLQFHGVKGRGTTVTASVKLGPAGRMKP